MMLTKKYSLNMSSKRILASILAMSFIILLGSCASKNTKVKNVSQQTPKKTQMKKSKVDYQKQFAKKSASTMAQAELYSIKKTEGVLFSDTLTLVAHKKYSQALSSVNLLIRDYPKSIKMPKYLFLKTRIYSEMNLKAQAVKSYKELAKKYPDSHESKMALGWIQ